MKIALCVNHFHPLIGGCESVTKRIVEHLSSTHEVAVFTRRVRGRKHTSFSGYRVYEYNAGDQRGFFDGLGKFKPEVIFVYSDVFDFFRHLISRRNAKDKLIVALCGANWIHSSRGNGSIVHHYLPNIHRFVVHSKTDRDYRFCQNRAMLNKTVVIPNGVDLQEFDGNNISRPDLLGVYNFPPEWASKKWVLNISNFFPGKGQNHLFPILSKIKEDFVYLQVASDIDFAVGSQLEAKWKLLLSKSVLHDRTRLLKNIPRNHVVAFLKQSSVFAFTSEKEVAPLVLLESMASTLPWIATDAGNATELQGGKIIRAIKTSQGFGVIDERVYRLFADAIQSVWGNAIFAEPGRQQIEQTMNWEKILPQYASLIET